jgi:hypothetical protein
MGEIERIFRIALIQKIIFMIMRAAWVGGAVYLACWGTNRIWGWLPNERSWSIIALITSVIVFCAAFLVTKPSRKFVWRLDREYSLQEQVFTLYEVLQEGGPGVENQPGVRELIDSEHISRLAEVRRKLVDKGWRVKEEFEATIVVLILLMIVYLASVSSIGGIPPGASIEILPSIGIDPSIEQVFPRGIPGDLGNGGLLEDGSAISINDDGISKPEFTKMEWVQIRALMRELGRKLSEESGSYALGNALAQDNYPIAANQFSYLAESVDEISPEIQIWMAGLFLETAVGLQNLQQHGISSYFQEASAALFAGEISKISEEMDDLAELMKLFAQSQEKEVSANQFPDSINNQLQSLEQYRDNSFVIGEVDDLPDYVSSPSANSSEGEEVFGESLDFIVPYNSNVIEGVLLPYQFSLEDFDVVSSYFSPQ